jgi:predicted O-methyltransferase YrrM
MRPDHVFEIGCYRAGTTEAICRALYANGGGTAHTVDPFCAAHIKAVLKHWPPELLNHVRLHDMDSMNFYMTMQREGARPDLIFVDGHHDYEFAMFDVTGGARAIKPGGFIFMDNVAQAGPFFAGRDFLAANPGWREIGTSIRDYDPTLAFDRNRTTIVNTDFMVLRAPSGYWIGERPRNFGPTLWSRNAISGLRLKVVPPAFPGTLHIQVVLRGFGATPAETPTQASVELTPDMTEPTTAVPFPEIAKLDGEFIYYTCEPWLIWRGAKPLQLTEPPEPF